MTIVATQKPKLTFDLIKLDPVGSKGKLKKFDVHVQYHLKNGDIVNYYSDIVAPNSYVALSILEAHGQRFKQLENKAEYEELSRKNVNVQHRFHIDHSSQGIKDKVKTLFQMRVNRHDEVFIFRPDPTCMKLEMVPPSPISIASDEIAKQDSLLNPKKKSGKQHTAHISKKNSDLSVHVNKKHKPALKPPHKLQPKPFDGHDI